MTKIKNQKRLRNLSVVLAVCILSGVVFAAVTGVLVFGGNVTLGERIKVDIVEAAFDPAASLGATGTIEVSADGQSAELDVVLNRPWTADPNGNLASEAVFVFRVENVGSVPAWLEEFETSMAMYEFIDVMVDWGANTAAGISPNVPLGDADKKSLAVGQQSTDITLTIRWGGNTALTAGATPAQDGTYAISEILTIGYGNGPAGP
ncbi:MAG: hypothetical protein FWG90_11810 [Oscillospiraceae bacterium]|nr:hypothetical protein [Oscillospiraceae bacterium]